MIVVFIAGIAVGIAGTRPLNVYPVFVGLLGDVIEVSKSCVIDHTGVPQSLSKVIVYWLMLYSPVTIVTPVIFEKSIFHHENVYHVRAGFTGAIAPLP